MKSKQLLKGILELEKAQILVNDTSNIAMKELNFLRPFLHEGTGVGKVPGKPVAAPDPQLPGPSAI